MQYLQPAVQPRLVTINVYGPFDHRDAVFVERQQVMQRNRQIVEIANERPIPVDAGFRALAARPGRECWIDASTSGASDRPR